MDDNPMDRLGGIIMKKFLMTVAIVLFVCVASVFFLTACKINLEGMDGDEYFAAQEKSSSLELVNAFFEETLKDPDFVVTCKNKDGEVEYTETVKGTDSYTLDKDGTETYAFKKGEYFYWALVRPGQRDYYCSDSTKNGYRADSASFTMEDAYKSSYFPFMYGDHGVAILKGLPEENATFDCSIHNERISGFETGTLTLTYTSAEGTLNLTATSEESKVKSLCIAINAENSDSSEYTWTFVYGGASVTVPDTDAWDRDAAAE